MWTSVQKECVLLPINGRVVILQPIMSNKDVRLSKISDCELHAFNMVLNYHSLFDGLGDGSISVESSIGIVDRYRTYEFLSINMVGFNEGLTDARASTATVKEDLGLMGMIVVKCRDNNSHCEFTTSSSLNIMFRPPKFFKCFNYVIIW